MLNMMYVTQRRNVDNIACRNPVRVAATDANHSASFSQEALVTEDFLGLPHHFHLFLLAVGIRGSNGGTCPKV